MTGESEVQGIDNNQFGNNGSIDIVRGSVNEVTTREGIGGGHFGTREDFPDDIKVLEEERPVSLASRQLARVLYIRKVFVVSGDGDRMGGSLDILFPFFQCENHARSVGNPGISYSDLLILIPGSRVFFT